MQIFETILENYSLANSTLFKIASYKKLIHPSEEKKSLAENVRFAITVDYPNCANLKKKKKSSVSGQNLRARNLLSFSGDIRRMIEVFD